MGKRTIVFSGGGSGGHVIPARTLIQELEQEKELNIFYIGSQSGIERKVMGDIGVAYYPIKTGKLRRYLSVQNFLDIFNILLGILQSFSLILKLKPRLIILTGGFVIVPVAIAGFILRVPMYLHEQTTRIGLANKLASFFVKKVMISFESSAQFLPPEKTILTGYPVRDKLFQPIPAAVIVEGVDLKQSELPVLFITGGGNGSELLNHFVEKHLPELTKHYLVVHQTGRDHLIKYQQYSGESYIPLGFMGDEYIEILKLAKCIISRSGAGTVAELLAIGKKSIYVPLKIAQKNEQFHNAKEAERLLGSIVISEDEFVNDAEVLKLVLEFEPSENQLSAKDKNPKDIIKRMILEAVDLNS